MDSEDSFDMSDTQNLSVTGDVSIYRGETRLDVGLQHKGKLSDGEAGVFADTYGVRGGHVKGGFEVGNTQVRAGINANNFGYRDGTLTLEHESDKFEGQASLFGNNKGAVGGHAKGFYTKGNAKFGATINADNCGYKEGMIEIKHQRNKWERKAGLFGDTNGGRGGQVGCVFKEGNTQIGATIRLDNRGNNVGMINFQHNF